METLELPLKEKKITASIQLRQAIAADFYKEIWTTDGETGRAKQNKLPNMGQPYWMRSAITGLFDNNCQFINESTNWDEMRTALKAGQIYVPVSTLDL